MTVKAFHTARGRLFHMSCPDRRQRTHTSRTEVMSVARRWTQRDLQQIVVSKNNHYKKDLKV